MRMGHGRCAGDHAGIWRGQFILRALPPSSAGQFAHNLEAPVKALGYGKTTLCEHGSEQRNLRLVQLVPNLSRYQSPSLAGGEHQHQAVANLSDARRDPRDWCAPEDGKVKLCREFLEPR